MQLQFSLPSLGEGWGEVIFMKSVKRIISEPYLANSRSLRKNQTPWEGKLWYHLRAGRFYGLKFKRQVQVGSYIYDFSCREKMVLIELDGGQHNLDEVKTYDTEKEKFTTKLGYRLLRFWNNEVYTNIKGVLSKIKEVCGV